MAGRPLHFKDSKAAYMDFSAFISTRILGIMAGQDSKNDKKSHLRHFIAKQRFKPSFHYIPALFPLHHRMDPMVMDVIEDTFRQSIRLNEFLIRFSKSMYFLFPEMISLLLVLHTNSIFAVTFAHINGAAVQNCFRSLRLQSYPQYPGKEAPLTRVGLISE